LIEEAPVLLGLRDHSQAGRIDKFLRVRNKSPCRHDEACIYDYREDLPHGTHLARPRTEHRDPPLRSRLSPTFHAAAALRPPAAKLTLAAAKLHSRPRRRAASPTPHRSAATFRR